jgi:hypothetical protein
MKLVFWIAVVAAVAWLGLWVTDRGVLVYSEPTKIPSTRDCRYLIGVTVVKRYEPLAQRCQVIARMGR